MTTRPGRRTNERVRVLRPYEASLQREEMNAGIDEDQVLIRCCYSAISPGTELGLFTGSHGGIVDPGHGPAKEDPFFPGFKFPFSPGYAAVGEVEMAGTHVHDVSKGDIVYYPGRHQRYSIVSPALTPVIPVPSSMSLLAAPFARFGQIASTALVFSEAGEGDLVAVIGLGLIGNLAAQLFRIHGASVIGADFVGFRRVLARQAGIHHTIEAESGYTVSRIMDASEGNGARTVIEATGNPRLVESALQMAAPKGEVILLGSPLTASGHDEALSVYVLHLIHRKGVRITGAHESLIPVIAAHGDILDQRTLARKALDLIDRKHLVVEHLISDIVRPGEIERAYTSLLRDKDTTMAVLIDWTG
ncbi:MAG TPA: zinc-binding alcohol dehydrogenase [Thermomicrobiales bacterium]|nr:zinc-binding alcohol dehydrogenase [Thermomicrobiales bacterium]